MTKPISVFRGLWRMLALHALYKMPEPDWAPTIEHKDGEWKMRR